MPTTYNPADKHAQVVLSGGNLVASSSTPGSGSVYPGVRATQGFSSGKWYWELLASTPGGASHALGGGIATTGADLAVYLGGTVHSYAYHQDGRVLFNAGALATGLATITTGKVVGVAFNADAGEVSFYSDGVLQYTATGVNTTSPWYPATFHYGQNDQFTANFGDSAFAYTPPSGFIGPDQVSEPGSSTGQGAGTLEAITGVGWRVAAGAGVLQAVTGIGGRLPWGEASLLPIVGLGSGGRNYGEASLSPLTGAATGHDENDGVGVLEAITGEGTGGPQSYWTLAGIAPAPSLAASLFSGNALVLVGAAPPPLLVATGLNPAVIAAALAAPAPRLVATLLPGNVLTATLAAPAPVLVAMGYPPYVLTFAGSAPAPRLSASLVAAVASTFRTWALNVRRGALTEYTNFEFNSYAIWNGQVLAVGAGGLVALDTSELDGATAITGVLRTGKHDFGTSQLKRVPRVYFDGAADGDVTFRTITSEGGTRGYVLPFNGATGMQQRRVPVGKGPKSAWWQFEVESDSDFAVDRLLVYPVTLRRRVQ